MRKLAFLSMFVGFAANAIPTISVPNLVYTDVEVTPMNINNNNVNASAGIANTANKTPALTTSISQQIKKELPAFNADVRGAIISSGQFKVISMPKQDNLWTGNSQAVLDFVKSYNTTTVSTNHSGASKPIALGQSKAGIPDYILLGEISSITQNEDFTPIKYTDQMTNQYNINIAVDYKLVKTSDYSVMSSFTAYGHGNDVKILSSNNANQVQTHNIPLLVKKASQGLGADVITQLNAQFGTSSENYNNGSKVVTDVKVYN